MNTKRKNTFLESLATLAEISPAIVLIGSLIAGIVVFFTPLFQSDLRGESNCGSWKIPVFVEKELAEKVKGKVELLKTMHTISVQNYGGRAIDGLVLTFPDALNIEVQKNALEPISYSNRKSVPLERLEPHNKDTISIKVWTEYPVSFHSKFEIKQDGMAGTEVADIHCMTPVRGIAAMVNKHKYTSWGLILLFVYLLSGFSYLWLRPKLSLRMCIHHPM